jgi:DNA-directed RNA polymerase beta' subunit
MLKLLDIKKVTSALVPITTSEIFIGKSHSFHPDGLFSEKIFGALETPDRKKTFSYIELNCQVIHPALFPILRRLEQRIIKIIQSKQKYNLDKEGNFIEDPDGQIFSVSHLPKIFGKINFRSEDQKVRQDYIDMLSFYHKKGMVFIDRVYVMPPTFRDLTIADDGSVDYSPINEYYLKIIRHSQQLRTMGGTGVTYDILSNRMNDLVLELYDYLTSRISKKSGLIRQNMLGKRIDFTARAVITGSADEIKPYQIGIPFKLLVKLFEPFIIYEILNSNHIPKEEFSKELETFNNSKLNANSLRRLFLGIYKQDDISASLYNLLALAVDKAIDGKVVLAKRDPALHAESIQAYEPVRVEGNTIKLNPLKCASFNADFDGDQMAVYVPITRQAIEEAKEKMIVSKSKDGIYKMLDSYEKDVVVGIYVLTQNPPGQKPPTVVRATFETFQDKLEANTYQWIKVGNIITTVGRYLFNSILPSKYRYRNEEINRKKLTDLATRIFNENSKDVYNTFSDNCLKLAFKYGTINSPSFSIGDFEVPKDILALKEKLKSASSEEAQKIIDEIQVKLKIFLEEEMGNIGVLGKAGSLKGGYDQIRQVLVAKGLIADNSGNVLDPISESYVEGFNSKDFFTSGAGSRRGIADRVINTSDTGYLSRQLVYALQRVEADPKILNCKTTRPFMLKVTDDIAGRLNGRYLLSKSGTPIKITDPTKFIDKVIPLKSPLYCRTSKICRTCYGELLLRNETSYVGVLAGQIFGERGTQMIMRTFHTGGAISVVVVDIMKVIANQLTQSNAKVFVSNFQQKGNDIFSNTVGKFVLKKDEYLDPEHDIHRIDDIIDLAYGYFYLEVGGLILDITIDTKTILNVSGKNVEENNEFIIYEFGKGELLFTVPPSTDNFLDKIRIINHLLSGKKPYRSADHFCMKIYDQYKDLTKCDLIHFEILSSHLLRDSRNPSYPARLNADYNPVVVSLKKIPQFESWLSALSFENPAEAISTGLIYEREQKESVLEQIVNGTL